MTPRKPISKRVRFAVFARDGFTCRYCGRQSDEVVLTLDHLIPHSQGGADTQENLITACEACNAGKSDTTIEQHAPNEADRLRLAQERNEQRQAAADARAAADSRREFEATIIDYWCEVRGKDTYHPHTLAVLVSFARQYGPELVFAWIDLAQERIGWKEDHRLGMYISGIRRQWLIENPPPGQN